MLAITLPQQGAPNPLVGWKEGPDEFTIFIDFVDILNFEKFNADIM
jgi:hypothetical protein